MTWAALTERNINLRDPQETAWVAEFLARFDLTYSADVEVTLVWVDDRDDIVATGSLKGEVLRNFAIDETLQGEGILSTMVSRLMDEAAQRGRYHYFVYTKPDTAGMFTSLGFAEIGRAEPYAVLLETGMGSVQAYARDLAKHLGDGSGKRRAAIVMNCNPFTLGHRYLIETAAAQKDEVIIFVVAENLSLFPAQDRLRLVQAGVRDLPNVSVISGGRYIISSATFPGYFTKGDATVIAQTKLDIDIFARHIAPPLGIGARYVGEEPYCATTEAYNEAMRDILPRYGVELVIVPRSANAGDIISASKVREAIKQDRWDLVRPMVPDSTWEYLQSPAAAGVIEKIKASHSRH